MERKQYLPRDNYLKKSQKNKIFILKLKQITIQKHKNGAIQNTYSSNHWFHVYHQPGRKHE
jgi:hypothetical protein